MQHDDTVYVGDMYDFAVGIARRAEGLDRDAFDANEDLRLAIVQLLSWIGVAARKVSPEFQSAHPEVPWGLAIGMRNILAHDYFNVDWDVVYKTATVNIPWLVDSLREFAAGPSGVAQLWTSTDQAQWEAVLDQYWNCVRPDRFDLEHEMEKLTPAAIENLDAEQWHVFLRDKYFRWKYTAPNRYATTTACLKRQAEKEGLDALLRIRDRILTVADGPIETALNTVCEISGLGPAGASGLLALLYPRAFGTFDQFVTKALCAVPTLPERESLLRMRPETLTVQDGAVLIWIMREKAAWLNAAFGTDSWTPRKVDMVLWTCGH